MKQADPFYLSAAWSKARNRTLARDRYRCARCGVDVKGRRQAIVHHLVPRRQDPSRALDPANLVTLCRICHGTMHDNANGLIREQTTPIGSDGFPIGSGWS